MKGRSKSSKSVYIVSDISKHHLGKIRAKSIKKDDLNNLYYKNKMSQKDMAGFYGVSLRCIQYQLSKHNIKSKTKGRRNQRGLNHNLWRTNPSYRTIHKRVELYRGKPNYCDECKTTDYNKKYDWANISGNYLNVDDFRRLCVKCHKKEHPRDKNMQGRFI
jgi:hypothetical protein